MARAACSLASSSRPWRATSALTCGMKTKGPARRAREQAVEHQRVDMDVEIHRAAEALKHGDAAATSLRDAVRSGPRPQMPLDRPVQDARHPSAQVVTPRPGSAPIGRSHAQMLRTRELAPVAGEERGAAHLRHRHAWPAFLSAGATCVRKTVGWVFGTISAITSSMRRKVHRGPRPRRLTHRSGSNAFFHRFFGLSNLTAAGSNAFGSKLPPAQRRVDACSSWSASAMIWRNSA